MVDILFHFEVHCLHLLLILLDAFLDVSGLFCATRLTILLDLVKLVAQWRYLCQGSLHDDWQERHLLSYITIFIIIHIFLVVLVQDAVEEHL